MRKPSGVWRGTQADPAWSGSGPNEVEVDRLGRQAPTEDRGELVEVAVEQDASLLQHDVGEVEERVEADACRDQRSWQDCLS